MTQLKTLNSRIDVADVLRGISVLAILLLHSIEHFNFYSFPDTSEQSAWLTFADRAIWDGMFFAFGGKAYAIFALLFGFSFFIQDDNQLKRGNDFRLRFCWRLVLLFLLGNLNALFYTAEVLVLFSIMGFVLPLACRMRDKTIFILACIMLIQPVHLFYVFQSVIDPEFITPAIPTREFWAAAREMQIGGSFLEMTKVNLWEGQIASLAWAWDNGRMFQTAALFLLGMLIGRRGLFRRDKISIWYRVLGVSLLIFFPLMGIVDMLPKYVESQQTLVPLRLVLKSLQNFAFTMILVSSITLTYYNSERLKRLFSKIIPFGRMSLTNYITQSIFGSMLYYHWGLSMHDDLTITASILVGVAFFFVQLRFCRWWLERHNQGPLEYLWKRATWLK